MLPRSPRRWSGVLLAALVATSTLLGASLTTPSRVAGLGPLPACRYDDILTAPRGYDDWSITLVDTILRVGRAYVPPDLVRVADAGIGGSGKVRSLAIADLAAMTDAAKAAGNPIAVQSAYRSYDKQVAIFRYWVDRLGRKQALLVSARPGHSEHQLGLAIDFKSAGGGPPFEGDWGKSPAGSWMRKHAWQYGWLLSYPKGERSKTCYAYEPWHFRYVGPDLAAAIHASGLTVREYLWAHFTTAIVPTPSPPATPWPSDTPAPSDIPSPAPSALPSPSVAPSTSPALPSVSPGWSPAATASASNPLPSISPTAPAGAGMDLATAAVVGGLALGLAILAALLVLRRRRPGAAT